MRKLLITSNVLLLAVLIFISCSKQDGLLPSQDNSVASKGGEDDGKPCRHCHDYTALGFNGLNAATATSISQSYRSLNQPLIEISDGNPDANSVWFSLEALKNFVWKIEEAACTNKCPDGLKLGLRLYYGKYPGQLYMGTQFPGLDDAFAERHTVFIVPTFTDEIDNNIQWDFDPWHWGPAGCKPISMSQWFATSPKPFGPDNSLIFSIDEDQYYMNPNGTLSSAMNHGNLIPPYPSLGTAY